MSLFNNRLIESMNPQELIELRRQITDLTSTYGGNIHGAREWAGVLTRPILEDLALIGKVGTRPDPIDPLRKPMWVDWLGPASEEPTTEGWPRITEQDFKKRAKGNAAFYFSPLDTPLTRRDKQYSKLLADISRTMADDPLEILSMADHRLIDEFGEKDKGLMKRFKNSGILTPVAGERSIAGRVKSLGTKPPDAMSLFPRGAGLAVNPDAVDAEVEALAERMKMKRVHSFAGSTGGKPQSLTPSNPYWITRVAPMLLLALLGGLMAGGGDDA